MSARPLPLMRASCTAGIHPPSCARVALRIGDLHRRKPCAWVAAICFRAFVFERGRIVAELRKPNVSQEQLTRIASGEASEGL
jgi:hypothetical protein